MKKGNYCSNAVPHFKWGTIAVTWLTAKISGRENFWPRKFLTAKISDRENSWPRKFLTAKIPVSKISDSKISLCEKICFENLGDYRYKNVLINSPPHSKNRFLGPKMAKNDKKSKFFWIEIDLEWSKLYFKTKISILKIFPIENDF